MSLLKLAPVPEPSVPETQPPPFVDAVLRFDLSTCIRTPDSAKLSARSRENESYVAVAVESKVEGLSISAVASCTTEPSLAMAMDPVPFEQPRPAQFSAANPAQIALEPIADLTPQCFANLELTAGGAGEIPAATALVPIRGVDSISWSLPPVVASPKADSVAVCAAPVKPLNPRWNGDLRKFDWAQLIARLADFESSAAGANQAISEKAKAAQAFTSSVTAKHKTPRPAQEPLMHRIPVLGPALAFWDSQSWLVRALVFAIPILALIALKPSFDGSLSEPVVLAKTMPPASSTVLRRMPSREQAAERGAKPFNKPVSSAQSAAAPPPQAEASQDSAPPIVKPDLPIATVEPRLTNMDRMLLARAAVELVDDFSFGLDSWDSNSANSLTWSYDQTGFIRPRGLALFRPSMSLTNYTVEFLAKIDASAVGWAIRAMDHNNYHAVKIVQRGGGPLPRYTIVRYTVVDGREGPRIEHPLPLNLYKDTLFRIRMDIRGSNYSLLVQDSVVGSWSDNRFEFGGMGFFSGRGEESRIRWVQVTYQNDLLGKICAWLAPKTS